MSNAQRTIKYAVDRVVAGVMIAVLAPVFVAVWLAIKLDDRGPVFFRHARPGLDAQPFMVWKFRSMVVDADKLLDQAGQPMKNRVTRVGSLLRRTSIDELPQLINIVNGEMSFVGPRPALTEQVVRYTPEQMGRFRMRPGITGLAQVSGRNSLPWSRRIALDNEYIDSYGLLLDMRILLRTVGVVLTGSGQSVDRNPGEIDDLGPAPDSAETSE